MFFITLRKHCDGHVEQLDIVGKEEARQCIEKV